MIVNLEKLVESLSETLNDNSNNEENYKNCSVSIIIDIYNCRPRVLFMKRAKKLFDPWSGHISLPGGMSEPFDKDFVDTSIRESFEEVGIKLERKELIGKLSPVQAVAKGKKLSLYIHPFVYILNKEFKLKEDRNEVDHTFWVPLEHLVSSSNEGIKEVGFWPFLYKFPAIIFKQYKIWGLTYKILKNLKNYLK